jgi:hypothetical protein
MDESPLYELFIAIDIYHIMSKQRCFLLRQMQNNSMLPMDRFLIRQIVQNPALVLGRRSLATL